MRSLRAQANRKLQGEIDRTLKKVQEGVEIFDGIWNKGAKTQTPSFLSDKRGFILYCHKGPDGLELHLCGGSCLTGEKVGG